jgi:hypothetical protein
MSVHWCAPRVGQNKTFEKANTCTLYVLWLKKTCNFYFVSYIYIYRQTHTHTLFTFKPSLRSHRSRDYFLHSHTKFIQLRFSVIAIRPQFWIIWANIIPFVMQSKNFLYLWKNSKYFKIHCLGPEEFNPHFYEQSLFLCFTTKVLFNEISDFLCRVT